MIDKRRQLEDARLEPSLSPAQREQLREIEADESAVSRRLDVRMPGEVLLRVNAQMIAAMKPPHRSARRIRLWAGSAVAAAAAACLVLAAVLHTSAPGDARVALSSQEAAEAFLSPVESTMDVEMDVLHEQLASLQQDDIGSIDSALQMQIDAVNQDITTFWLDGSGSSGDMETGFID